MAKPSRDNCGICGRDLIAAEDAPTSDDPRIDCGGDCLWCMYEVELGMGAPADVICTKPRGWDEAHPTC